jgi:hypothetical protein
MSFTNTRTVRLGLEPLEAREVPATLVAGPLTVGTGGPRVDQCLARSDNGNSVVVWEQMNSSGTGSNIYARLYNSGGAPLTGTILVNPNSVGDWDASVAIAANGRFVVAWTHTYVLPSSDMDVRAQVFDSVGNRVGGTIWVAAEGTNERNPRGVNEQAPDVAMDANGNFAVAYEYDYSPTDRDIYVRQFTAAGGLLRTVGVATTGLTEQHPTIDMNRSGQFVVAYEYNSGPSNPVHLYARSYNSSGAPTTGYVNLTDGTMRVYDPSVAMDSNGNYVVAYTRDTPVMSSVYAQRVSSAGQWQGGPISVGWDNFRPETEPSVDMAADGRFVVSYTSYWGQNPNGTSDYDVVAQQFNSSGTAAGGPFYVAWSDAAESASTVAMDSYGNFTVVDGSVNGTAVGTTDARFYRW